MRHAVAVILLPMIVCPRAGHAEPSSEPAGELIVFVGSDTSAVRRSFETQHLPAIKKIAGELNISTKIVEASNGVPDEVAITPLLVFQNHRGRSIYQGRYTTHDRVRNFLRTSMYVTQGSESLVRRDTPVWQMGRAKIAAPIKIAPVSGTKPPGYDHAKFTAQSTKEVVGAFEHFRLVPEVRLGRSDRMFYMDFNPWRANDGTLFVSLALFSQFHCKEPVFVQKGDVISGPWKSRNKLFARAARAMESAVEDQLSRTDTGDGFEPVASLTPTKSWNVLGLQLPTAPKRAQQTASSPVLGTNWRVDSPGANAPPMILFRFPPPLDLYAGEVKKAQGQLKFAPGLILNSATGHFEIDVHDVTMGDPDLDHTLMDESFLHADAHPNSKFVIESIDSSDGALAFGRMLNGTMRGTFTMKGIDVPLSVPAGFEVIVNVQGKPQLIVTGAFSIDQLVAKYSLEGPDGPVEAKDRLLFDFRFVLTPVR